tara:strand:- start:153 stop:521 length:369 start_codon:yes stop_codon:yes gene_type:complete
MNKKKLKEFEEKLKTQEQELKAELQKFAKEDIDKKGDWGTKFPQAGSGSGGQALEDAADQVEEYANLLPVEHSMELRLQSIGQALEKIKKGKYGKCEGCGKNIKEERLEIYPEAKMCSKCHK